MVDLKRVYWGRLSLKLACTGVILWLASSVVLALMPDKANTVVGQSSVPAIFREMFDGLLAAAALPGAFVIVLTIAAAIIVAEDVRRRDPVRRFTHQQRRQGMARADGLCEMEAGFRRRCSRPAEHGDHFYPWSTGGSTSLQNFVAACARCNRTKGARIPSPGQQERLERRRREYVAFEGVVSVGERRPLP